MCILTGKIGKVLGFVKQKTQPVSFVQILYWVLSESF